MRLAANIIKNCVNILSDTSSIPDIILFCMPLRISVAVIVLQKHECLFVEIEELINYKTRRETRALNVSILANVCGLIKNLAAYFQIHCS